MMRAMNRYRTLSRSERRLLIPAVSILLRSTAALKLFGFRRVYQHIPRVKRVSSAPVSIEQLERHALAIRRASNALGIGTCLSRSLALREMLARNGMEAEFRIGVNKEDGALIAHAWLEYEGRPIGEIVPADYKAFAGIG